MRQSQLFGKTMKETPSEASNVSTELLLRGGFIRESVAGRYYLLPLGMRVQDKIMKIIEEEMNEAGAQKMITPTLHPLELWQETNRTSSAGFELMKVKDRRGGEFALGGTAEEMLVDLVRKFTVSYKDLPFNLYQFSQKFRDEMRARGGLLRVREFMMKDAYSFHRDEADFKKEYKKMWQVYENIFKRSGLNVVVAESDNGYIGGDYCHEFVVESKVGESKVLSTEDNSYTAHQDVAKFLREEMNPDEKLLPIKEAQALRGPSIEDGVKLYNQPAWRQIKTIVYKTEKDEFVLAAIRGDLDINETKLCHALHCVSVTAATEDDIKKLGSIVGFVSPLKLKVKKVGDSSLKTVKNFYTGADQYQIDSLNVNYERDFNVDVEADIGLAQSGYKSESGKALRELIGIEVGNIFQLGEHYSSKMKATFMDEDGKQKFYYMGCYGIGVGRVMASVIEKYHDAKGIIWPTSISPFSVHLISLCREAESLAKAEELYNDLQKSGIDVLYDDRVGARAGEKFADSDLIGIPYRIVISEKTIKEDSVELKERTSEKAEMIKIINLIDRLKK